MNKLTRNKKVLRHGMEQIYVKFYPNGDQEINPDSMPDGYSIGVKSISRTSEGLFTITLQSKYRELVGATVNVSLDSAAAVFGQIGVVDLSASTFQVRILGTANTGAPAVMDIGPDDNDYVVVGLLLQRSSAHP